MKLASIRTLIAAATGALVLALGSVAATPEPLEADDCDGPGDVVCNKNESCLTVLFYRQCTTTYDYYPPDDEEEDEAGGEEGDDEGDEEDSHETVA